MPARNPAPRNPARPRGQASGSTGEASSHRRPAASSGRRWRLLVAAYAALLLILSTIPVSAGPPGLHLDTWAHLSEYGVFAWLLVETARRSAMPEPAYRFWAWMYATTYGLLMELLQAFVPWRSADWHDALTNALGAAIGVWIGNRLTIFR